MLKGQFRFLSLAALASTAFASQSYVVTASTWGDAQTAAVTAAGGLIKFKHARTGTALVTSDAPDFLDRALASKAIATATPDVAVQWYPAQTPVKINQALTPVTDTFFNLQWGLTAIEASAAWAAGFTGKGARVAVVDGGIYDAHPDLEDNIDKNRSISFVTGLNYNEDFGDAWHGTQVAGIIASAQNSVGIIGVAPQATIIAVKVLDRDQGNIGDVIAGILYAATPVSEGGAGADIINLSLGLTFPRGGGPTGAGPLLALVNQTVNFAASLGVLVVASAGNDRLDLDHSTSTITVPAMSGSTLAVSATGPSGYALGATNFRRPASYTNYGNSLVDLAAPGGDFSLPGSLICGMPLLPSGTLVAGCGFFDLVITTDRGSGPGANYALVAGTSMAAPVVSGVAALLKQRFPKMTASDLKAKLAATSDDEGKQGHDPYYGKGFVNARRAVTE